MPISKHHSIGTYLWAAVAVVALILLAKQTWVGSASLNNSRATARAVAPRADLLPEEKSNINIFRQASPSVVNITAIGVQRDALTLNLYQIPQGTGSGFVWDKNGDVNRFPAGSGKD